MRKAPRRYVHESFLVTSRLSLTDHQVDMSFFPGYPSCSVFDCEPPCIFLFLKDMKVYRVIFVTTSGACILSVKVPVRCRHRFWGFLATDDDGCFLMQAHTRLLLHNGYQIIVLVCKVKFCLDIFRWKHYGGNTCITGWAASVQACKGSLLTRAPQHLLCFGPSPCSRGLFYEPPGHLRMPPWTDILEAEIVQ